jgi:hypothetical protein
MPYAGIAWLGTAGAGVSELFRFTLETRASAGGSEIALNADFYLCGDRFGTIAADAVSVQLPAAVTSIYDASMDTFVSEWDADARFGSADTFSVRQKGVANALIAFDIADIPTLATVDQATMTIYPTYRTNVNDLYLAVYALEASWWDGDVTWNTAPAASDLVSASITVSGVGAPVEIDVTNLVQQWVADPWNNFGLLLAGDGAKSVEYTFPAWDHGSMGPTLEVSYH